MEVEDKIRKAIDAEITEMRESFLAFSGLYGDFGREEMIESLFDGWEERKEMLAQNKDKDCEKCGASGINKHFSYPVSKRYECGSIKFTDGVLEESALCLSNQSKAKVKKDDKCPTCKEELEFVPEVGLYYDEKIKSWHGPEQCLLNQLKAAQTLCQIYFEIACESTSEDAVVNRRDEKIEEMLTTMDDEDDQSSQ